MSTFTFILILAFLAIFHFVYEGIVAPSIRIHLRNRLFSLRDELRSLKVEGIDKQDEHAFWLVHEGINHLLNRLPNLTVERRVRLEVEYEINKELQASVKERMAIIMSCNNKAIKDVFGRTGSVIESAFLTNMGGWFVYILPIAFVFSSISKLSSLASELIATSERDTNWLLPQI